MAGTKPSVKSVVLSNSKLVALVNSEDYDRVVGLGRWYLSDQGYAVRRYRSRTVRMHRFILDTSDGLHTDHINRNKLDNRRENLRAVSAALNAQNGDTGATKTVYKDLPRYITYDQSRGKFVATFVRRKRFDTLEEAKEYVRGGQ